uniref:Reverse transcriptase domain-containing protein n=1 Tax=Octopus bimaculoides TaxID=37653 RepID=A0A0L8H490_OCTBM
MVQAMYDGLECTVVDDGDKTRFEVTTGVKQGYIMRRTTEGPRNGIKWNLMSTLEDLGFADDIALLSSTYEQILRKTQRLAENADRSGLKLNPEKKMLNTKEKCQTSSCEYRRPRGERHPRISLHLGDGQERRMGNKRYKEQNVQSPERILQSNKCIGNQRYWPQNEAEDIQDIALTSINIRMLKLQSDKNGRENNGQLPIHISKENIQHQVVV